jgi:TctA family transporter
MLKKIINSILSISIKNTMTTTEKVLTGAVVVLAGALGFVAYKAVNYHKQLTDLKAGKLTIEKIEL